MALVLRNAGHVARSVYGHRQALLGAGRFVRSAYQYLAPHVRRFAASRWARPSGRRPISGSKFHQRRRGAPSIKRQPLRIMPSSNHHREGERRLPGKSTGYTPPLRGPLGRGKYGRPVVYKITMLDRLAINIPQGSGLRFQWYVECSDFTAMSYPTVLNPSYPLCPDFWKAISNHGSFDITGLKTECWMEPSVTSNVTYLSHNRGAYSMTSINDGPVVFVAADHASPVQDIINWRNREHATDDQSFRGEKFKWNFHENMMPNRRIRVFKRYLRIPQVRKRGRRGHYRVLFPTIDGVPPNPQLQKPVISQDTTAAVSHDDDVTQLDYSIMYRVDGIDMASPAAPLVVTVSRKNTLYLKCYERRPVFKGEIPWYQQVVSELSYQIDPTAMPLGPRCGAAEPVDLDHMTHPGQPFYECDLLVPQQDNTEGTTALEYQTTGQPSDFGQVLCIPPCPPCLP